MAVSDLHDAFQLLMRHSAQDDPIGNFLAVRLRDHEKRVVGCVADGMSNEEIAAYLELEVSAVKAYLGRIYVSLDIPSRSRLIVAVYRHPALFAAAPIPSFRG